MPTTHKSWGTTSNTQRSPSMVWGQRGRWRNFLSYPSGDKKAGGCLSKQSWARVTLLPGVTLRGPALHGAACPHLCAPGGHLFPPGQGQVGCWELRGLFLVEGVGVGSAFPEGERACFPMAREAWASLREWGMSPGPGLGLAQQGSWWVASPPGPPWKGGATTQPGGVREIPGKVTGEVTGLGDPQIETERAGVGR